MVETKLEEEEERRDVQGYNSYYLNNRTAVGGVAILVKETLISTEVKKNKICETLWVKINGDKTENVIIGGTYSPCENVTKKEKIKQFTDEIETDIIEIGMNNDTDAAIIMVGDFNAHMSNDKERIPRNHRKDRA